MDHLHGYITPAPMSIQSRGLSDAYVRAKLDSNNFGTLEGAHKLESYALPFNVAVGGTYGTLALLVTLSGNGGAQSGQGGMVVHPPGASVDNPTGVVHNANERILYTKVGYINVGARVETPPTFSTQASVLAGGEMVANGAEFDWDFNNPK
ncbi:MAG: hypothetical protein ABIH23_07230 [bacterium]